MLSPTVGHMAYRTVGGTREWSGWARTAGVAWSGSRSSLSKCFRATRGTHPPRSGPARSGEDKAERSTIKSLRGTTCCIWTAHPAARIFLAPIQV